MRRNLRSTAWFAAVAVALTGVALVVTPAATPAPGDVADLGITKSDSPDPVTVGQNLTYTLKATNHGPAAATNVIVTDNLPNQVDFVSANASQGSCKQTGPKVVCNIGSLSASGAGNTATVTIVVKPRKAGTLSNTATVTGTETDNKTANNSATETTQVKSAGPTPGPAASCRGVPATIKGTGGDDQLTGTGGPDVIVAFAGNDQIVSGAGRDLICAGPGSDLVNAGGAKDRVFGAAGADRLLGRGGPDVLKGGRGNDVLKGNRGNDVLRGGRGSDKCRGGAGVDSIRGCER